MRNKKKTVLNTNTRKNFMGTPPIVNGITPEQIKFLMKKREKKYTLNNGTTKMARLTRRVTKRSNSKPGVSLPPPPRPNAKYLTTVPGEIKKIELPEKGSFNAGLASFDANYVLVYRPNEYGFKACILDKKLNIQKDSFFKFSITNCADPRIIWTPDNKLLMVYASTEDVGMRYEYIRGAIIMDGEKSDKFIDAKSFRISPVELKERQKNWTPFVHEGKIYLVASVCPHIIYELKILGSNVICRKKYETEWYNPWFYKEFLRGNTNPVRMENGNYLSTFHTAVKLGRTMHYYDNGCYEFEGKPPFKVLRCSNRTYLPAEAAVEPHYRKKNVITVCFPVGAVLEQDDLLISYGDNDSCVRVLSTNVEEMLKTTVEVYN